MNLRRSTSRRWFTMLLYATFSLFFLVASVISTSTYVSVIEAQDKIVFENPISQVDELPDGTIRIRFSIDISNPTRYMLTTNTLRADVGLYNGTQGPGWYLPITSSYDGPTSAITVDAHSTYTLTIDSIVSDSEVLADIRGFINYSSLLGIEYTFETVPYAYEAEFIAWIGDFQHEYLREFYLNEIVKIDIVYDDVPASVEASQ